MKTKTIDGMPGVVGNDWKDICEKMVHILERHGLKPRDTLWVTWSPSETKAEVIKYSL